MNSSASNPLKTAAASQIWRDLKSLRISLLEALNSLQFARANDYSKTIHSELACVKGHAVEKSEDFLNDLFILRSQTDLLDLYASFWSDLLSQHFKDSWDNLQAALGELRVIKRFSQIDVAFFEDQLLAIEQLYPYPYELYASIGCTVGWIECSICGNDVDSPSCKHRCGQLYGGEMAGGIVHDIGLIDHVALVKNPQDKRCVTSYENNAREFHMIRYFAESVASRQILPLDLPILEWSIRKIRNERYVKLERNALCFCDSGKKFKKCCESKEFDDYKHVDIGRRRTDLCSIA